MAQWSDLTYATHTRTHRHNHMQSRQITPVQNHAKPQMISSPILQEGNSHRAGSLGLIC